MRSLAPTAARVALAALLAGLWLGSTAAAAPWILLPTHDAAGSTGTLYWVDLAFGGAWSADARRGGEALRLRRLDQNLFTTIGRRQDAPAAAGQFLLGPVSNSNGETLALLLAESDTGYMALLTRLGRGGELGELRSLGGRPGTPVAAADGNFVLLMRRDARGRTDRAYLVHGTTGECVVLRGLDRLQDEPGSGSCRALPPFEVSGDPVPLEASDGTTTGYLLATGPRGAVMRISLASDREDGLTAAATGLHLAEVLGGGAEAAAAEGSESAAAGPGRRFALAPIRTEGGGTRSVLAADSVTGRLALLHGLADPTPAARLLARDVAGSFPARNRALALVPRVSAFASTLGVWVIDAAANRAALVENPEGGRDLRIVPVEIQR